MTKSKNQKCIALHPPSEQYVLIATCFCVVLARQRYPEPSIQWCDQKRYEGMYQSRNSTSVVGGVPGYSMVTMFCVCHFVIPGTWVDGLNLCFSQLCSLASLKHELRVSKH